MKIFENFINEASGISSYGPVADKIIRELEKNGYKIPSQISVVREGSPENNKTYSVTIKDLKIDEKIINEIVKKYKSMDYDAKTGEITKGTSRIFVNYDYWIKDKARKKLTPLALTFIEQSVENNGEEIKLKNGYSFKLDIKDSNGIKNLKKGYTIYESFYKAKNIVFFNRKDITKDFADYPFWWILVAAGY